MRSQNRNVLPSISVEESMQRMKKPTEVLDRIAACFELLEEFADVCGLTLIKPLPSVRTCYALLRSENDTSEIRRMFDHNGVRVMWGHEFGLTNRYIRIETTEPGNIQACIEVAKANQCKLVPR